MSKRTPALGFILLTVFIDVLGVGLIIPIIPELLLELGVKDNGSGSLTGGFLYFSYALMQFVFAPILGGLSDQYGRRTVLLISLFGLAVDYTLTAFAPVLWWLFLGRIIAGIGGASFTTASAYIADISAPEKRAQNFGMIGAAFGIGFVIGPVVGGLLGGISVRLPFFVAAGLTALNWLYGYFILPESLSKENRRPFEWKRANPIGTLKSLNRYTLLKPLFIAFLILYVAGHSVQSNWSFFGAEVFQWGSKDIGYSLAIVGISVALVQAIIIKLVVNKIGQEKTVYAGLFFNFLGLTLFAMVTQEWMIYAFLVVYVFGGLAGPTLQAIMSTQVPADEQGELMGGLTSIQSVSNIFGPLLMTGTFFLTTKEAFYFPGSAFALGALCSLISGFIIFKAIRRTGLLKA